MDIFNSAQDFQNLQDDEDEDYPGNLVNPLNPGK